MHFISSFTLQKAACLRDLLQVYRPDVVYFLGQAVLFVDDKTVSRGMVKYTSAIPKESIVDISGEVHVPQEPVAGCTCSQVSTRRTPLASYFNYLQSAAHNNFHPRSFAALRFTKWASHNFFHGCLNASRHAIMDCRAPRSCCRAETTASWT